MLSSLPAHILHDLLLRSHHLLTAQDLASLEASCYCFRQAFHLPPYRFKSLPEMVAMHMCSHHPYLSLPPLRLSQLLARCHGSWKLALRFLDSLSLATRFPSLSAGQNYSIAFDPLGRGFLWGGCPWFDQPCPSPSPLHLPSGLTVAHVSAFHLHAALITQSGLVYTWGDNAHGCCGQGDSGGMLQAPTLVAALMETPVNQIQTGNSYTVAVSRDKELFSWGCNSMGQLGLGDQDDRLLPEKAQGLSGVAHIAAGFSHTLVCTEDGSLFSFGNAQKFCLGHNQSNNELRPRLIRKLQEQDVHILAVFAGEEQSAAIDSSGFVYTWGLGFCGALGHGDENNHVFPTKVMALGDIRAVQISTRKRKLLILDDNGDVFGAGWSALGSLIAGTFNTSEKVMLPQKISELKAHHVTQISTGFYHTVLATKEGKILGYGDNEFFQLTQAYSNQEFMPVDITLHEDTS